MIEHEFRNDNTIRLAERVLFSDSFKPLYKEGMSLVEEAAAYLDGAGRDEAKSLSRTAATFYAAESMRLTTRLMQIASWLLLQRAARSGELTRQQVAMEKSKVRLDMLSAADALPGWTEMPASFIDIIERSLRLQDRVRRMDDEIYGEPADSPAVANSNPVSDQLVLLQTAFGGR
ncbi:DUF1465 family protein [Phyllobacterium salinisoli]|uniref:DUF1465 family protein n=1 Tax=Phyllobacterium salinisoli TaxID=1899321 RepID=A0A368K2T7_9HYPH|nr:DUF1465 family protein [Phyllobacterium salinisoli]RCS23706.1 DUF1465 family protein [Phyllobacterium salinisoli]